MTLIIYKNNLNFEFEYDLVNLNFYKKNYKYHNEIITELFGKVFIFFQETTDIYIFKNSKYEYDSQLLKSNIQKAFRRKNLNSFINTSYQLINQDLNDFLRRIPIIILEDGMINFEDLKYLVCLMIFVSKNYKITNEDVNKINLILNKSINCKYRDFLNKNTKLEFDQNIYNYDNIFFKNFYLSIFLRIEYGTMDGDKKWLSNLANVWFERMKSNKYEKILKKIKEPNCIYQPNFISKKDMLLEAVDFHCDKTIFDKIKLNNIFEDRDTIQNAIWYLRSSINYRKYILKKKGIKYNLEYKNLQNKYLETFNKIKEILENISLDYWNKNTKIKQKNLFYYLT